MSIFLGVDGGGTSTDLVLITGAGDVLATHTAPTCYSPGSAEGVALVGRVLGDAIGEVCAAAGITPDAIGHAFVGLPGYGEASGDLAALDAAPRAALGHDRYACDNDMVCGWAGSLGLADGINVVSGTGSIAYGRHGSAQARVGGWGELFGDEGSGYWIAVRGLQLASRMSDGRRPPGPLLDLLRQRLALDADLDLVDVVLTRWHSDRTRVAALSRWVVEAARQGDRAAAALLAEAGAELAAHVAAVATRVGFGPDDTVPVSWSGGVFAAVEVRDAFTAAVAALGPAYALRRPRFTPLVGAALCAAWLAGTPLDEGALDRLDHRDRRVG